MDRILLSGEAARQSPSESAELHAAFESERVRTARLVTPIRLVGVLAFLGLFLVLGFGLGLRAWQGNLPWFVVYAGLAAALFIGSKRSRRFALWANAALPFFDVPMVFIVQASTLPNSGMPGGVAGFTIAVNVVLVTLAALTLDVRLVVATAVSGTLFGVWIQTLADVNVGGRIATLFLMGIAALTCGYASRRLGWLARGLYEGIAARKRMETQLVTSERMASLGTVAAGVVHELNNPLTCVLGYVELALVDPDLKLASLESGAALSSEKAKVLAKYLREIESGAQRVRWIVQDLKTFSRPDDEQKAEVDLCKLVRSSVNLAGAEVKRHAQLSVELAAVPKVMANEARLGQVFLNLLVNAAQAIPENETRQKLITVRSFVNAQGSAVVSVSDTGTGIQPEHLPRLFDPFFTTKPPGVGTGLGLSICYGIVKSFGGAIEVDTELGKGSTFRVVLPTSR